MTADLDGLSLGRAEALLELGRAGEARTLLQALLASAPENVYVWCLLSQACLGCEDPAAALDAASLAAGLDGDEEWAHRLRASALDQLGRGPDAVAAAEEAVRCAPHSWQTHACLADMLADNPTLPPHLARVMGRNAQRRAARGKGPQGPPRQAVQAVQSTVGRARYCPGLLLAHYENLPDECSRDDRCTGGVHMDIERCAYYPCEDCQLAIELDDKLTEAEWWLVRGPQIFAELARRDAMAELDDTA